MVKGQYTHTCTFTCTLICICTCTCIKLRGCLPELIAVTNKYWLNEWTHFFNFNPFKKQFWVNTTIMLYSHDTNQPIHQYIYTHTHVHSILQYLCNGIPGLSTITSSLSNWKWVNLYAPLGFLKNVGCCCYKMAV